MARTGRGYPNKPIVVRSFVTPVIVANPTPVHVILPQPSRARNRPGRFVTLTISRNLGSAFPPTPAIISVVDNEQRLFRQRRRPPQIYSSRATVSQVFATTPKPIIVTPSKNTHQKSKYAPNDIICTRAPRVTQTTVFATTPNARVIPDRTRRDELRRKKYNKIITAFPQGPGSPLPIPVIGTAIPKLGRKTGLRAEAEII